MRIAITGAHKVGKTTLAEDLLEHLPGYTLDKEPYYELEESGYIFSEIPDADDFIKQFEYSVQQIGESGANTIFDRCPIDILAYIHAIDPNRNIESLFETAQSILSTIDLLVFVPIESPDLISGQQSDLPKLRYKVNDILDNWIWDLGIDVIEVSGTVSNRRDQLLKKITF
ncbi:AAA domain-containing protein [Chitinophaga sp. YR627]|uniref:ATP/GTP-binding protein n=1 Tax=Chitinophaga sp. YR627 TaxID=1881041 RepID=UPI0008E86FEC|nr:ATP-binding protein [Chitinophaga sp. YR627]SFM88098.1 AAA domain-containing protein [Chitinophaga sp. YR627]